MTHIQCRQFPVNIASHVYEIFILFWFDNYLSLADSKKFMSPSKTPLESRIAFKIILIRSEKLPYDMIMSQTNQISPKIKSKIIFFFENYLFLIIKKFFKSSIKCKFLPELKKGMDLIAFSKKKRTVKRVKGPL